MKKILIAFSTVLVLVSCEKETGGNDPSGMQEIIITCGQEQTKVSGSGDASTGAITFKWQNGDYLYIQEGSGAYQYFPLEGGSGSVNGKFRGEVTSSANEYTVFNVQWPDATPSLGTQTYVKGGIQGEKMLAKKQITGLSNLKKSFALTPQYAVVRLDLKGAEKVKTVKLTVGSTAYTLNCTSVQLSDATAVPFYIVVKEASAASLSVVVTDTGGTSSATFTNSATMNIEAGKTYKLKELYVSRDGLVEANSINGWTNSSISIDMTDVVDLSEGGTKKANCYRIDPKAGWYRLPLFKGNSTTSVESAKSAKVFWETTNTSTAPTAGTIIKEVYILNGWVYFKTEGTTHGNALIAVYDDQTEYGEPKGNIMWSWHIWKTSAWEDRTFANSAGKLMNKNLGALAATDDKSVGLHYQWGRKDPFMAPAGLSTSTMMKLTGSAEASQSVANAMSQTGKDNALVYSIQHPGTFLYSDTTHDWYGNTNTSVTGWSNRWGSDGSKSMYDPCPYGYKVPTGTPKKDRSVKGFFMKAANDNIGFNVPYASSSYVKRENYSTDIPKKVGKIKDNGGSWRPFPMTGYHQKDKTTAAAGEAGQYWTNTLGGFDKNGTWYADRANCFNFNEDSFGTAWGSYPQDGCSVRCMKE